MESTDRGGVRGGVRSARGRRRWWRWPMTALALVGLLLLGPLGVLAFGDLDLDTHWSSASRASSGMAPAPAVEPRALIQVYGARTYNWRGAFGIHTWIATKRGGADRYTVYHVIGWNLYRGRSVVTVSEGGPPDFYWFNARPALLADRRGPEVEALIDRVQAAVAAYPYPDTYRAWPGPNSNTFTAFVARQVPELGLDLPANAIGKDYLANGNVFARMPSGTGWQVSLLGVLGLGIARGGGRRVQRSRTVGGRRLQRSQPAAAGARDRRDARRRRAMTPAPGVALERDGVGPG